MVGKETMAQLPALKALAAADPASPKGLAFQVVISSLEYGDSQRAEAALRELGCVHSGYSPAGPSGAPFVGVLCGYRVYDAGGGDLWDVPSDTAAEALEGALQALYGPKGKVAIRRLLAVVASGSIAKIDAQAALRRVGAGSYWTT